MLGRLDKLPQSAVLAGAYRRQEALIEWQSGAPGEFHRQGILRFAPIGALPQTIELHIAMPDEPNPRVLRWSLR